MKGYSNHYHERVLQPLSFKDKATIIMRNRPSKRNHDGTKQIMKIADENQTESKINRMQ